MLLNRSVRVFQQYLQRNIPLAITAVYVPKCSAYKENIYKYEYKQKRDFKNFGHTRKKVDYKIAIPFAILWILCLSMFFDWLR